MKLNNPFPEETHALNGRSDLFKNDGRKHLATPENVVNKLIII